MAARREAKGQKKAAASRKKTVSRRSPARKRAVVVTPAPTVVPDDGRIRLNRFLAAAGVCSRRSADGVIAKGRVIVNGDVVTQLGTRIDPAQDDVRCDGQRVRPEPPVYVLFNKPKGIVCTNARNEVRKRAIDFLEGVRGRLYTVGRLDAESEGLILLTNDGDFAQAVSHPRYGIDKTYAVLVRGRVSRENAEKARGGVWLAEGRTGGARIRIERTGRDRTYLKLQIHEGKNREVRRIFARLGHSVISLKRVRIGSLTLHGLGVGKHRFLTRKEVADLLKQAKKAEA